MLEPFEWGAALAWQLTGRRWGIDPSPRPDVAATLAALEADGWGPETVAAFAAERRAAGHPWPVPLPQDLREATGPATVAAVLAEAKRRWDLDQPVVRPLAARAPDADERRLMADLPPHHGHVG